MKTKNRTRLWFAEAFVEQLVSENVHIIFRFMEIQKLFLEMVAGDLLITFDLANTAHSFG